MGISVDARSTLIFSIALLGLTARADEDSQPGVALREVLAAIADPSETAVANAVSAFERLNKDERPDPRAVYAMALIRVQREEYDEAQRLLGTLSEKAADSTPIRRLRLWLAVKQSAAADATPLFTELVKRSLDSTTKTADRMDCVRFLGGLVGMLDSAPEPCISARLLKAAKDRLSATEPVTINAIFRQSYEAGKKRSAALTELIAEVRGKGAEKSSDKLSQLEASLVTSQRGLAEAKATVTTLVDEDRSKSRLDASQRRDLSKELAQVLAAAKAITPGHPGPPPQPPAEPRRPSRPSAKATDKEEDDYKKKLKAYEHDLNTYPKKLDEFKEKSTRYPGELAAWEAKDRLRREALQSQKQGIDAQVASLKQGEVSRDKGVTEARHQLQQNQTELRALTTESSLLRAVVAGNADELAGRMLLAPENYALISFEAEQERIKQTLK